MRRMSFVVAALAAPACGPAQAQGPAPQFTERCDGMSRTEADERELDLRDAISARRKYTLRADRAFVRMVERSASARERGANRGFPGALTPSEARYFDVLRPRVEAAADRLAPFERAQRDIFGGISIEDDVRGGPFLLVRLVAPRPERFLPQLRRLAGVRVRVARVPYSEHALDRLQERVGVLFDRPPAGVAVGTTSVDIDASRVVITVATRRTDVQAELERRFGPAVRVDVLAPEPTAVVCSAIDRVTVAGDDRTLTLHWGTSSSIEFERAVVEEGPEVVRVGVLERVPTIGGINADLRPMTAAVQLSAPLGARRLVDAETGRPLAVRRG
jgi:hypothetical protein